MDTDRWRITAETTAIKGRGWLRLLARLAGIVLLVVGALALFGIELWTGYRTLVEARVVVGDPQRIVYVADFVVAAIGAAVAGFV